MSSMFSPVLEAHLFWKERDIENAPVTLAVFLGISRLTCVLVCLVLLRISALMGMPAASDIPSAIISA